MVTLDVKTEYTIIYCGENQLTLNIINHYKNQKNILLFCNTLNKDFYIEDMIVIDHKKIKFLISKLNYKELILVDTEISKDLQIQIKKVKLYYNKYNFKKDDIVVKNILNLGIETYVENLECKKDLELLYNKQIENYKILDTNYNIKNNDFNSKNNNIVVYNKNIDLDFLRDIKNKIDENFKIIIFTNNTEIKDKDFIVYKETEYYNKKHLKDNKLVLFTESSDHFYWIFYNSIEQKTLPIFSPIFLTYNNKLLTTMKLENIKKSLLEKNYRNVILNMMKLIR